MNDNNLFYDKIRILITIVICYQLSQSTCIKKQMIASSQCVFQLLGRDSLAGWLGSEVTGVSLALTT